MSKWLLLVSLMLTTGCFARIPSISEVRVLYQKAAVQEQVCRELLQLLQPYTAVTHPMLAGYKASATMMMANYVLNPLTKLSYFTKGKKLLEQTIEIVPANAELRFLRFAIQTNIPSFLGYKSNIGEDKIFLLKSVALMADAQLRQLIVPYLTDSDFITQEEKRKLLPY